MAAQREVPVAGQPPADVPAVQTALHPAFRGGDVRLAPGHIHAVNPEHGEPVTIQPGELMPDWLLAELEAGAALAVEAAGVFRLVLAREHPPRSPRRVTVEGKPT